jgi:hypothetical protein
MFQKKALFFNLEKKKKPGRKNMKQLYQKRSQSWNLVRRLQEIFFLERATIVPAQGASEDKKFAAEPTQLNSNFVTISGLIKYLCVFLFITPLHTLLAEIYIEAYQRENIVPLLPFLNTWGERAFSAYPYLLCSPKEQIVCPSDLVFVNSTNSLIILAKKEDAILGLVAMISFDCPMLHAMYFDRFQLIEKMQRLQIDYSRMLYVAYFLTAPECHNDETIVDALYDKIRDFAKENGKTQLCFMDDIGDAEHRLKPLSKTYIEPWGDVIHGCTSLPLQITIAWPTIDAEGDREHTLAFFAKDL